MWRKNRASPPPGSHCYGVDLNRNYEVVGYGIGASDNPCSNNYKGQSANSQPEVIAASTVVLSRQNYIRVSLSLHSYGKWPTLEWQRPSLLFLRPLSGRVCTECIPECNVPDTRIKVSILEEV